MLNTPTFTDHRKEKDLEERYRLTSVGQKIQSLPRDSAKAAPSEDGRSQMTARAPCCTNRSTVALPKPEAPPVIKPTRPYISKKEKMSIVCDLLFCTCSASL